LADLENCTKFGQLILSKIIKIVVTSCQISRLKCRYLQPFPRYWALSILGVTTLTFQGHVTSSVTWPLDSRWSISYWCSIGPKSLSLTVSEVFRPKHHVLI